jgi:hypothetical protein
MPWEDQISHSKVSQLRTVGGSRHEFVDRENRIVLEYKIKDSANYAISPAMTSIHFSDDPYNNLFTATINYSVSPKPSAGWTVGSVSFDDSTFKNKVSWTFDEPTGAMNFS